MRCTSCDKQKADLHTKKSKLIPSMVLYMCADCIKAKYEPRFVIVLHGRQNGPLSVADYIRSHKYVGEDILAKEIIT